jgi:cell division protein FtsB
MAKLFGDLKQNKYVENMKNSAHTQLSLLNTLNELQNEYEAMFNENIKLKAEILKMKNDRK